MVNQGFGDAILAKKLHCVGFPFGYIFLVKTRNNLAKSFLVYSLHDEQNAIKRLISKKVGENNFQGEHLNGYERY